MVSLSHDTQSLPLRPTAAGFSEMQPDTLKWRPLADVLANLDTFPHVGAPVAFALRHLTAGLFHPVDA